MKLRVLVALTPLCAVGFLGCEKTPEQPAEAAPAAEAPAAAPAAPAAAPQPSAKDACVALVDAAKAKDADKVASMATAGSAAVLAKAEAKTHLVTALGGATCGEAMVDKDNPNKAIVPATMGTETHDLPFMKEADAWKFDAAAYSEKYPAKAEEKGKKGKAAKDKGKKKGKKK